MSSIEPRRGSIRLGSSHIAVAYPQSLDPWFDGAVIAATKEPIDKWVEIVARGDSNHFDVAASSGAPSIGLDLGEALAMFWERVGFLLVDDLADAMALHAGVLSRDGNVILLPGGTGAGKSHLCLWYRRLGFEIGSDETATVALDGAGHPAVVGALPRPIILKSSIEETGLLGSDDVPLRDHSSYGTLLRVKGQSEWAPGGMQRCLVVFPRFRQGAPLTMKPLTTARTGLRLVSACLNVRNLPRGGLALASALARRAQAIELEYGGSAQLDETLDVLTRQLFASQVSATDLAALCAAFTARDGSRLAAGASSRASKPNLPEATSARYPRRMTIGMATYDDFDGVYFTIQSIRNSNPELEGDIEFVVIDNNPGGMCSETLFRFSESIDGCRYVPRGDWSGTAIRNAVFEEASSPVVACIDSHVLIAPGALAKLLAHFEASANSNDLVQGPMVYDDLRRTSTHMEPHWRGGMWGIWASDPRGADLDGAAFDIPMQGLGLFACRRSAWAGFNPGFRGFGGEEGYIHEKTRQRGGRTLCLPALRWIHRFGRPNGAAYVNRWEDRIRNYLIGFAELGLDTTEMEAHFAELLGAETSTRLFAEIRQELGLG